MIKPIALGLSTGIMWGAFVAFIGFTSLWFNWGTGLVAPLGTLYIGYQATVVGALIGGAWAFADGFVGGLVLAWIYNSLT